MSRRFPVPTLRRTVAATLAAAVALLAVTAVPALAAPTMTVGIRETGADPQKSGETFTYQVAFQCANAEPEPCEGVEIRIPLGAASHFDVEVGDSSDYTWEVVGGDIVVRAAAAIPAGSSVTFPLSMTPPNNTTLDGTTWTLDPTASSSNASEDTDPPPGYASSVDSTATATVHNTITKTLVGSAYRQPGDEVTWQIRVACNQSAAGNVFAESMTVTDSLPAGLTYVSSSPAGSVTGQDVSWSLPGDATLPTSCTEGGANGSRTFEITAEVDAGVADGTVLTNPAASEATGLGGAEGDDPSASSSITVVDDQGAHPGTMGKGSFGQLADDCTGTSCGSGGSGQEANSHTTYPGPWNGYYEEQPGNVLRDHTPNQATGMGQSGYKMQYRNPVSGGSGHEVELRDPMPCTSNASGAIDQSHPVGGPVCAASDIAFHPTTVSVWVRPISGVDVRISDAYRPYAVLASGGTVDLVPTYRDDTAPGADHHRNYAVPTANVEDVAEIVFPRDDTIVSDVIRWGIFGYADPDAVQGDILRNVAQVQSFFDDQPVGDPQTDSADLYIVADPQIGIDKRFSTGTTTPGADVTMTLTGRLTTIGQVDEDVVITDLLPEGMSWPGASATVPSTLRIDHVPGGSPSGVEETKAVQLAAEVVDNFQGTGRQLVRFTLAAGDVAEFSSPQITVPLSITVQAPDDPGVYDNVGRIFYDDVDLSTACQQAPYAEQQAEDPLDEDANAATQRHCAATAPLRINPEIASASFNVKKTVQGDTDPAPKESPAIGTVNEEGGTVAFGLSWKNIGRPTLDDVVLYDIFPYVGDHGVSGTQAETPRNSEFRPLLTSIDAPLPAGVTVEYTLSDDPCRPEVYPSQDPGACDDDWTATPPDDLGTVTGLRVASSEAYESGDGFTVTVNMTTPPIEEGQIAWNSVAAAATDTTDDTPVPPTEPPKVGLTAFQPGPMPPVVDKTVDQPTAAAGDLLTYTIDVANPGGVPLVDVDVADTLPDELQFESATGSPVVLGQLIQWNDVDIPAYGTISFTVTATVRPGAVGEIANRVEVPGAIVPEPCADDPEGVCAVTTIPGATLSIEKVISGDAGAFAQGPFVIDVDCRIDDQSTFGFPQQVTLDDEGVADPIGVPFGSTCTAEEIEAGGATHVTVEPLAGVLVEANGPENLTITVTNDYEVGELIVQKDVTGVGEQFGTGPFVFTAECTFEDATVLAEEVTLTAPDLTSDPIGPLPVGAECTVTETDSGSADETPDPVAVTIVEDDATANTVTAVLTNRFSAGVLAIEKQVDGRFGDSPEIDDLTFDVLVTCQLDVEGTLGTVHSSTVEITAGERLLLETEGGDTVLLPAGAHCFAEETDAAGASAVTIDHDSYETGVVVEAGTPDEIQELELVVVNTFDTDLWPDALPDTGGLRVGVLGLVALTLLVGLVVVAATREPQGSSRTAA